MSWFDSFRKPFGSDYSLKMFMHSVQNATELRKVKGMKDDNAWSMTVFLFLFFYLHLTDRFAFGNLDDKRRDVVMSELESLTISSAVNTIYHGTPKDMLEKIREDWCIPMYNTCMSEWGQCKKIFPEKGEAPVNTLFWEVSKTVAKAAGHENDIACITMLTQLAYSSLEYLNPKSFIEQAK